MKKITILLYCLCLVIAAFPQKYSPKEIASLKKQASDKILSKSKRAQVMVDKELDEEFRPQLTPSYYDETKYDSYLEQLGIQYPTLKNGRR